VGSHFRDSSFDYLKASSGKGFRQLSFF